MSGTAGGKHGFGSHLSYEASLVTKDTFQSALQCGISADELFSAHALFGQFACTNVPILIELATSQIECKIGHTY